MTKELIQCVCVWYDNDPGNDKAAWIVSRDAIDRQGNAHTTRTLSVFPDEDEAEAEALKEGARLRLPVYRNPLNGTIELIQDKPADE
jgi:hypothetical protein